MIEASSVVEKDVRVAEPFGDMLKKPTSQFVENSDSVRRRTAPLFNRARSSVPLMFTDSRPVGISSTGRYSSRDGMYVIIWKGTISIPSSAAYLVTRV